MQNRPDRNGMAFFGLSRFCSLSGCHFDSVQLPKAIRMYSRDCRNDRGFYRSLLKKIRLAIFVIRVVVLD